MAGLLCCVSVPVRSVTFLLLNLIRDKANIGWFASFAWLSARTLQMQMAVNKYKCASIYSYPNYNGFIVHTFWYWSLCARVNWGSSRTFCFVSSHCCRIIVRTQKVVIGSVSLAIKFRGVSQFNRKFIGQVTNWHLQNIMSMRCFKLGTAKTLSSTG